MNNNDIKLISEAYNKIGNVQESFNYMDLAKEVLHGAEEFMGDGVRHAFAEVWDGNSEYETVLNRYVEDVKELILIGESLKKGDLQRVVKLYKNLDMIVKDYLPKSLQELSIKISEVPKEEEE
jgi:hypothetical protein